MSKTNDEVARIAAQACRDGLSGAPKTDTEVRGGNVCVRRYAHDGHALIAAYSYNCPVYILSFNELAKRYELLLNADTWSITTARHKRIFEQELKRTFELEVENALDYSGVPVYRVSLGGYSSNGVFSRASSDVVAWAYNQMLRAMDEVYIAARRGTRLTTVESAIAAALKMTEGMYALLSAGIPDSAICSYRQTAINAAKTQRTTLLTLADQTAEDIKTVIRAIQQLTD